MVHLNHSGQYNFDACVATAIIATIAVALRHFARRKLKQSTPPAEWLCLVSLLFLYVFCGLSIYSIFRHSLNTSLIETPRELRKILFIIELLFGFGITAVKLSILAFYHNLFIASERFKKAVYATATLCIVWLIVATVIVLVQCRPINAFWDLSIASPSSPMVCYPSATVILGYEISNLLIDVIILLLPVVMVCRLRLPTWRKVLVAAIFLQGGFVCVTSIVRITRVWRPPNTAINIHLPTALLWTNIQYGAAVICACLPTYGPLLKSGPVSRVAKRLLSSCRREKRHHVSFHSWLKPGSGHDTSSVSKDVHDRRLRYDIESCNDEYSCKTIGDGQSDIALSRMSLSDDLAEKTLS